MSVQTYDLIASELRQAPAMPGAGALDFGELVRHAILAASSHNTQPWKFHVGSDSLAIAPDFSRRCPVVDPDDSHLYKSLGCAAENVVHAAAAQGFAASVHYDPAQDQVLINFDRQQGLHASALYHAIGQRQCARVAFDGTALNEAEIAALESAGEGVGVRTQMLLSPGQAQQVASFVTRGNLAQMNDAGFRRELVQWIRFNPAEAVRHRDGLAGRASGKPPIPRWLARVLGRVVLSAGAQAAADARYIASSAGIAVFVSEHDDKAAWVETGRVFERFALQAAALQVRVAFINQPIEVRELRTEFEEALNIGGWHAQLLLRFGHGATAPFSLRRRVEEVLVAKPESAA